MQAQVRVNNEEFLDYLKSLESWEDEMREKDQALSKNRSILKEVSPSASAKQLSCVLVCVLEPAPSSKSSKEIKER